MNSDNWELVSSVTEDGLELYYTSGHYLSPILSVAWRSDPQGPFEGKRPLVEINRSCSQMTPSVSADGLTLFWSDIGSYRERICPGCGHANGNIWYATRKSRTERFGPPICLGAPVNGLVDDIDPFIAWDWPKPYSKMYFGRYGPGRDAPGDIWEATWHPDCNSNGIDDLADIANGTSRDANGNGVPDVCENRFLRGDANEDGVADISDAIVTLGFLFLGEPSKLDCEKSADADDSGVLDISDPVYLLIHLFVGGPPPAAPFPECGPLDPAADSALECKTPPKRCQ